MGFNGFNVAVALLVSLVVPGYSTILFNSHQNLTYGPYESVPAEFGTFISPNRIYFTQLYYDERNPSGCPRLKFGQEANEAPHPVSMLAKPTTLLVIRGLCSFEDKARYAQNLSDFVTSVVVYGESHLLFLCNI